jgi:hypothetical protein
LIGVLSNFLLYSKNAFTSQKEQYDVLYILGVK